MRLLSIIIKEFLQQDERDNDNHHKTVMEPMPLKPVLTGAHSRFDFLKINNLCVNTIHGGYPIMGI